MCQPRNIIIVCSEAGTNLKWDESKYLIPQASKQERGEVAKGCAPRLGRNKARSTPCAEKASLLDESLEGAVPALKKSAIKLMI